MLERFPWCEMMEWVVEKEGEVVMSEGECESESEVGEAGTYRSEGSGAGA